MTSISQLLCLVGALIVGLFARTSTAFSPISAHRNHGYLPLPTMDATINNSGFKRRNTAGRSKTALRSVVFEPPPEDNCELDGTNCEESIFDRKRREKAEADDAIKERYMNERGIELSDIDLMESMDQYQNAPTGGNLIAGVSLSALCEDD